jgi:glycine cleavage system H protein
MTTRTPADLKYTASHEWVRLAGDGIAVVGITDFAQEALGDIVFVEFPIVGRKVKAGDTVGVVESVKAASDIYAPVAGEIVAVNEQLTDAWEGINKDAYAAWLFKMKPADLTEAEKLLDAATYAKGAGASA